MDEVEAADCLLSISLILFLIKNYAINCICVCILNSKWSGAVEERTKSQTISTGIILASNSLQRNSPRNSENNKVPSQKMHSPVWELLYREMGNNTNSTSRRKPKSSYKHTWRISITQRTTQESRNNFRRINGIDNFMGRAFLIFSLFFFLILVS